MLLDFWATWCGPCLAEMPAMKELHAAHAEDPRFEIVGLSCDQQIDDPARSANENGLAWTQVGGDLLSIEALRLPGKGRMKTTGKLGDVMKESIDAAASYVRSISPSIGVKPTKFDTMDIHVHVPEGATPKDGPSAGVAMVTAIISVLTGIAVRKDVAMTGEITLRGRVLPIGGLKEKLLAALRGGIKTVLIPEDNVKDLAEIPDEVKTKLELVPVARMEDVVKTALVRVPDPIQWDEQEAAAVPSDGTDGGPRLTAH